MGKSTVLIVDDSSYIHKLVQTCLELEPLTIYSAFDASSALRIAAATKPNLILLDVNMPGTDGFAVCKSLKADPDLANSAVLFLTSEASDSYRAMGMEVGAVDYITKPFKAEALRSSVRSALRMHHVQERSGHIDPLTGLWNESYLDEYLSEQLARAAQSNCIMACITADVSPVQRDDEHYGDVAGDEMLRAVADIMMAQFRGSEDTVCYFGDKKFVALLRGSNCAGAERAAERVRVQVERELTRGDDDVNDNVLVRCNFNFTDAHADGGVPFDIASAAVIEANIPIDISE